MGKLAARVSSGQKNRHRVTFAQLLTYRRFLSTEPQFSRRRGRRAGAGRDGNEPRTRASAGLEARLATKPASARVVLAGRELGGDRLGNAQAIDGGAHDTARVTCAFAARVDASGRLLVRIGQIACQSRLKVLPTNHADGA